MQFSKAALYWVPLMSHMKAVWDVDLKLEIQIYVWDTLPGIIPTVNLSFHSVTDQNAD